jgi:8-oxo-dGTP pyrophosphatase MutT (NUDIX family)
MCEELKETAAVIFYARQKGRRPKILLQHRTKDAPTNPDHFSPFGGALEHKEMPRQAAAREMAEELGLRGLNLAFVGQYEWRKDGKVQKLTHLFVSELPVGVKELREQQREGKDLGLFTFEEAKRLKIAREDRALIALAKWHFDYAEK